MNNNSDFNPEAWQTPSEKPASQKVAPKAAPPVIPGDVAGDVECVLQQIEERHVDITFDHDHWFRTGFAFADQFGEAGREYFHRACQFYPKYSQAECDKQYNYCLHANREGVTIRTFFGYAQDAGIDIRTSTGKSPTSPKPPKSPRSVGGDNGEIGDSGDSDRVALPTFSDIVGSHLPEFLQAVAAYGRNPKETDTMLLAAITVVSGCLPNIEGIYDDRRVYANLYYFLSARAGSGKRRVDLCRLLAYPIHRRLKQLHDSAQSIYEVSLAQWEATPKKQRGPKPEKPKLTMLYIPADSSSTAFNQLLAENDGRGIIFDTEADGLSDSFESDFGNYSKSFRAAYHHENISYHRRGGDEDVEIENPKLSVVLTGTPGQVLRLIKNPENGLCSRFAFYRLETELKWRSVLRNQSKVSLDSKFEELGEDFLTFYDDLCQQPLIHFSVTDEQNDAFDSYFSELMHDYHRIFQDDILGSVFRLGLICYRIAMVLTALRMKETGEFSEDLVCSDEDFNTALTISRVLAVHMAKIFDELSSTDGARSAAVAKTAKHKLFYAALPDQFDRQDYLEAAQRTGVPPSTAEKWIRTFCEEDGPQEKVEHGRYRKR